MKRTYRSKKDTGGCLDPRDVVLAMDEKASVFDAFYIKNIKQTKREMSVGASMFAASNKVRKRKYVKRLKDQELLRDNRESTSTSAFLTPDKSIHLKRALDPFDLLLNSSSTDKVPSLPVNNDLSPLHTRGKGKSYRKKKPYKKKFNYSSSETDLGEENDNNKSNLTQNLSDVLSHKLEIEKEEKLVSNDQSINNVVNDLSLLDKIQNLNSARHSLTVKDNLCMSLVKSPLCSTPFHKKYRGKSIFKFSPISVCDNSIHNSLSQKGQESSTAENKNNQNSDQNETTPFVSHEQRNITYPEINSPILQSRDVINKNRLKEVEMLKHYHQLSFLQTSEEEPFLGFSKSSAKITQNIHLEAVMKKYKEMKNETYTDVENNLSYIDVNKVGIMDIDNQYNQYSNAKYNNDAMTNPNSTDDDSNVDKSFDNPKHEQFSKTKEFSIANNSLENIKSTNKISSENTDQYNKIEQSNESVEEIPTYTHSDENSFNETEQSFNEKNTSALSQIYSMKNSRLEKDVALSERNTSETSETYSEEISSNESDHSTNVEHITQSSDPILGENSIAEDEIVADKERSSELSDLYSEKFFSNNIEHNLNNKSYSDNSVDTESLYESCNSDNEISDIEKDNKELLVILERLNDSVLNKYITNEANTSSDLLQSDNSNCSEFSSNRYTSINENDTLYESRKSSSDDNDLREDTMMNITHTNTHEDCNYEPNKSEEEIFVSFVTRRKRNEITKDSLILSLENSLTSTSSSDFDKTVLSNNKYSLDSLKEYNDNNLISDAYINGNEMSDNILEKENIAKTDGQAAVKYSPNRKRTCVSSRNNIDINNSFKIPSDNVGIKPIASRNSVASPKSDMISRKSNKLSLDSISRKSISKENELPSRNITTRKSSRLYRESLKSTPSVTACEVAPLKLNVKTHDSTVNNISSEIKQGIVLEPGKRWERSLSIYRRVTTMGDQFDQSILDKEEINTKGRKYRQSVINTIEMQDVSVSLCNESFRSSRNTLYSKPSRSTIKILRESNASRISLSSTLTTEDLGFLTEDCDDTIVELSKLSIIDSEHEVTVLDQFNDTSNRITTARDYVLRRCNQTDVILFDECYPDTVLKNCRKIGEGVYGEVFLWRAADGRARVLKIVPIAGDTKVNGESQKDYHEIISEIVIAMELSALRAPIIEIEKHLDEGQGVETLDLHSVENATDVFNEVLAVRCVYGSYPSRLLDLWELYDECKGSENDNPAILPVEQQFMVLELANAGQDLESYQFNNAEQAYALFKQVAFGLAVAEEAFQFEHRDLHWGNVLIAPTDQKYATFVLRGRTYRVARRGVAATIIDYSLSRLSLQLPSADTAALYNDLGSDDGLFDAVGDYQFEVYRLMRDKLGNDWKNFEPYTNILWLHYTVDKMITALRYTRTNTKIHKHYIAKLKEIKNRILDYGSVVQYVLTDNEL